MNCDNCGNPLTEIELPLYLSLPNQTGALGEGDRCANGSSADSIVTGFMGWKESKKKEEK